MHKALFLLSTLVLTIAASAERALAATLCAHTTCAAPKVGDTTEVSDFLSREYNIRPLRADSITVIPSGQEKFDRMFEDIRRARHSIHLEYFNFRNDSISHLLFQLLRQRASEGVEVRALFDGFGNSSNDRPLSRAHLDTLRSDGIEIYEFDRLRFPWFNHAVHRDHRKIVVIDGRVAYTGGMNVADYYIKGKPEFGSWHDIHMRLTGEAVAPLQAIFLDFWNTWTGQHVSGAEYYPAEVSSTDLAPSNSQQRVMPLKPEVQTVNRDPRTSPHIVHDTFLSLINTSQKQLQIINPYFTLCRHIKRALRRAVRRGVDVQIMVSEKSDIPVTPRVVEYNAWRMARAGCKVYVYQGGFHHSKVLLADSLLTFAGSANLNSRSLRFDYECNLLICSRQTTRSLQQIFQRDATRHSYPLTYERHRALGAWKRFKGWLFHFLAPLI